MYTFSKRGFGARPTTWPSTPTEEEPFLDVDLGKHPRPSEELPDRLGLLDLLALLWLDPCSPHIP
jgi:hypothetical protein